MPSSYSQRRRWFGALYLALAGAMLIWGLTWLHPVLKNWYFVIYWLVCFFLTGLAMVIALLDIRAIRKEIREDEKKLVNHIFQDVAPRNKNTRKTYSDSNGKNQTK